MLFEALEHSAPNDCRVLYGHGRALDLKATDMESNDILDKAIKKLGEALSCAHSQLDLAKEIGIYRKDRQHFRGMGRWSSTPNN